MQLQQIFDKLCQYAPLELSHKLCQKENCKDNSGIIIDTDRDIDKILFSLDLTVDAVNYAVENGYQLIVTHHPAIYHPIYSINKTNTNAIYISAKNNIGVISMHLNLDIAPQGIDYYLAKGLGAKSQNILSLITDKEGYGRQFTIPPTALCDIEKDFIQKFNTTKVALYGDKQQIITNVSSFCGSGIDSSSIEQSKESQLIVSSDIPHHFILELLEKGKAVMQVTHYSSEAYGHKQVSIKMKEILNNDNIYFFEDKRML